VATGNPSTTNCASASRILIPLQCFGLALRHAEAVTVPYRRGGRCRTSVQAIDALSADQAQRPARPGAPAPKYPLARIMLVISWVSPTRHGDWPLQCARPQLLPPWGLGPVPCPHRRPFKRPPADPDPTSDYRIQGHTGHSAAGLGSPPSHPRQRLAQWRFFPVRPRASAPVIPHRVQNHARAERRHRRVVRAVHLKEARSHRPTRACKDTLPATCCLTT
jgi:hypothetical protein